MSDSSGTFASLHTPPGRGGIAIVTLAGPEAQSIIEQAFRPWPGHSDSSSDSLQLGHLLAEGDVLDEAVLHRVGDEIDIFDINIHGGPVVVRRLLQELSRLGAEVRPPAGNDIAFNPAHPAWSNPAVGREMLAALQDAQSALAVAAVSRQWSAGLSELVCSGSATPQSFRKAAAGLEQMTKLLHPVEIALAGPPNAGKSTLTNALTGREVSVVHDRPGTTRDWVRELALFDGVGVWLSDTAGIWDFSDVADGIDAEAVRRARHRVEQAELVLLLDAGDGIELPPWCHVRNCLRVRSKCDLKTDAAAEYDVSVSAKTGEGLDDLKQALLAAIGMLDFDPAIPRAFTQRQADLLNHAADAMEKSDSKNYERFIAELISG